MKEKTNFLEISLIIRTWFKLVLSQLTSTFSTCLSKQTTESACCLHEENGETTLPSSWELQNHKQNDERDSTRREELPPMALHLVRKRIRRKKMQIKGPQSRKLALRQARLNQCATSHLSTDDHLTTAPVQTIEETPPTENRPQTPTAINRQPMVPTTALAVKQTRKKIVIKIKMDRYKKE